MHGVPLLSALAFSMLGESYVLPRPHRAVVGRNSSTGTLNGANLRILPLGASITYGYHSSSGNGYRLVLEGLLNQAGSQVTYVGSQCSGNMTNGNNEGHSGYVIGNMQSVVQTSLPTQPNVVLVYVGTNDMVYPVDPANAPQRMGALVQYLTSVLPTAVIITSTLFLETTPAIQARIDAYNQALPAVVSALAANGTKTLLADFATALTVSDLWCDGEHPIDSGYAKMANVFYGAVADAASRGWIGAPADLAAAAPLCTPVAATGPGTCSTPKTTSTSSTATSTLSSSSSTSPLSTSASTTTTSTSSKQTSSTASPSTTRSSTTPIKTTTSTTTSHKSTTIGHKPTTTSHKTSTSSHKTTTTIKKPTTSTHRPSTTSRRAFNFMPWWE